VDRDRRRGAAEWDAAAPSEGVTSSDEKGASLCGVVLDGATADLGVTLTMFAEGGVAVSRQVGAPGVGVVAEGGKGGEEGVGGGTGDAGPSPKRATGGGCR